jgi:hypothetical protein
MAQSIFSFKSDIKDVLALAQNLGTFDTEGFSQVVVDTLNRVAGETYDLSRKKMLAGVNLNETYVRSRMEVRDATKTKPVAEIVAPVRKGYFTNISHYGALQGSQPVNWSNEKIEARGYKFGPWPKFWEPRTGSTVKGVAAGSKIGKMSAAVTKGSRKSIGQKFTIPGKVDTEGNLLVFRSTGLPGNGKMDRKRRRSRDGVETVLGPSVYQLFRFTAEQIQNEVGDNLEQAILNEAEKAFAKVLE